MDEKQNRTSVTYGADRPRRLEALSVKELDEHTDWLYVTTDRSSGFGLPLAKLTRRPVVGGAYELETVNYSQVTGLRDSAGWLYRLSDQDLDEQHRQLLADIEARDRAELDKYRDDWTRREAALPAWARDRIAVFRAAGGEKFELKGWGYELAVCELAVLYVTGDRAGVDEYAREHGTSGNQHDCAEYIARLAREDESRVGLVPAALAPLTGSADYS